MRLRHFSHPWGAAIAVLALLLFSLTAQAQPAPPAKGRTITGIVADPDGKPVAGATVAVTGGPSATTGADGSFTLAGAPTTALDIGITADGFTASRITVPAAATALQLELQLGRPAPVAPPPPATRMVGGVVSDASHAPIAGAQVHVQGTQTVTTTAADGSFSLLDVPAGDLVLEIAAPNLPPTTISVPADRVAVAITVGTGKPAPTSRSIKGKIIDPSSKEPIAGAQVEGAGQVAISEADGTFSLDNVPLDAVKIEVAAPEHESRALTVAAGTDSVAVSLPPSKGEQIIVEGRAPVIIKENLENGASVINDKDLNRVSAQTLDDAMNGKISGANLQTNDGAPGGGAQLRLRGISTINGQSSPLYVIDGVVISNVSIPSGANAITAAAAGGSTSNQDNPANRLADINPNDIETLEVLKGASAAALYGSKASNGVVVITTKRGKNGETHAEITQRIGFSEVSHKLGSRDYTSAQQVADAYGANSPLVAAFNAAGGKTYDHEAEIERVPFLRETLGSVTGGNDQGNYYTSFLVTDQPGVVIGTFYQKQTGRIAVGYNFSDAVHLGVTANIIHSTTDRGLTNNDNTGTSNWVVLASTPNFVNLQPTGGVFPVNPSVGSGTNPLQTVDLLTNREDVWRLITGSNLQIDAYSSANGEHKVKLISNFGVDTFNQKNNLLSPNQLIFEPADGLDGTSIDATTINLNWNVGAGAVWTYRPADNSFRSALSGGFTYESVDTSSVYVIAQNLNAGQSNVDFGTSLNTTEARIATRDAGLYLQEEIATLDDRLSLLGGLLGERSSLNGDTNKYFFYPKVAGAYSLIPPGKNDIDLLNSLETLRVRAAFGEAGNRPNYGNKFTPLTGTTNIDGNAGLVPAGLAGDAKIEPERQREIEVGADLATKDQRLVVELTAYQRNISNLLLQRALAPSTGFGTEFLNGGGLRNRGVEAAVQLRPISSKLVEWITRGTLTLNRSLITDLPADVPTFDITAAGFGAGLGAFQIEAGKSATQIVGTVNSAGDIKVVGNGEPDFRIGWSNVVTAGDFTFSALVDWQHGSDIVNLTRLLYDFGNNSPDAAAAAKRLAAFNGGDIRPYIEDASFVKLREVSVNYQLPKHLIEQMAPLKSLSFGLSGRNLLTITNYSGMDPEVSNFGNQPIGRNYDVAPYPPSRSFWFSVTAGI